VKREMPVPDPGTGQDRWSIDFVCLDQSATPTLVECKRFADTRSRREVVAQMIEYAANGHHYWGKDDLRAYAEKVIKREGLTLEQAIERLRPDDDLGVDDFFARAEEFLRQGQVRLVFFLEKAPFELKSIVEFLNKQMERTEVLLVEARQYVLGGTTVVAPTLFGYTEEVRQAKRTVVVPPGTRKKWDEATFFETAASSMGENAAGLRSLYDGARALGLTVTWGSSAKIGSFNAKTPDISPKSIFTVWSDGNLQLNFGWLNGNQRVESFRDALKEALSARLAWSIPPDCANKWPSVSTASWAPKAREFIEIVGELTARAASEA